MCGILGVFPLQNKNGVPKPVREAAQRYFTTDLLFRAEERGKDASGLAVIFPDSHWTVLKQPVAASDFTLNVGQQKYKEQDQTANYQAFMKTWRLISEEMEDLPVVIGHARKSTGGNRGKPENNHPLVAGGVIGVHNGTITNDDEIFKLHPERKRVGSVDSEGIFHLQHSLYQYEETCIEQVMEMEKRLTGTFTTLSVNAEFPRVISGMRRGGYNRAVEMAELESLGLVLIASEKRFLDRSIESYNRLNISITGSKLPLVKNVTYKNIIDKTGFVLTAGKACLKDAVEHQDFPINETHKLKEYKKDYNVGGSTTIYSNSNRTHSSTASTQPPKKASTKAKVTDTTDYNIHLTSKKALKINPYEDSSAITVEATVVDDEGSTEMVDLEQIQDYSIAVDGLEKLQEMLEDDLDESLFLKELRVTNVFDKLKVPVTEAVKASVLMDSAAAVYKNAFPEGYVCGFNTAKDSSVSPEALSRELNAMKMRNSKARNLIANLKTAFMAALVKGGLVDTHEKHLILDSELFDCASKINNKFNDRKLMSVFSSAKDIEKIESLLEEEEFENATLENEDSAQTV